MVIFYNLLIEKIEDKQATAMLELCEEDANKVFLRTEKLLNKLYAWRAKEFITPPPPSINEIV